MGQSSLPIPLDMLDPGIKYLTCTHALILAIRCDMPHSTCCLANAATAHASASPVMVFLRAVAMGICACYV